MSQDAPGQTLQPTALVHEAYLRLVDVPEPQVWDGRGHFFAAAAEAMRPVTVTDMSLFDRHSFWSLALEKP